MELSHQNGFIEELLEGPRKESWGNELLCNGWNLDCLDENSSLGSANGSSFIGFSSSCTPTEPSFDCPFTHQITYPFFDGFTTEIDSSYPNNDYPSDPFPTHQHPYPSLLEDEELGLLGTHTFDSCKLEVEQLGNCNNDNAHVFSMGLCAENRKYKSKKLEGQPSKNLMAERRRRKRLNDRLSMLRSIVPKISKMDRTSILGDTIDYMKELLDRINKLQEEEEGEEGLNETHLINTLKEMKPNEVLVRNSPKFHVKRKEIDTRIDICCSSKPGLLLSTVNTLEALGLEIQQCVVSCFNDFSMQASCSEAAEQRTILTPEDIKQALFRTAGYGGRCL